MWNTRRRWCVSTFEDAALDEIAHGLTGNTQVLCTGIRWRGLLLLNDAASEDGGQEYAVIDEKSGAQVESLTCSWMKPERLAGTLAALADGRNHVVVARQENETDPRERIETLQEHRQRRCELCA